MTPEVAPPTEGHPPNWDEMSSQERMNFLQQNYIKKDRIYVIWMLHLLGSFLRVNLALHFVMIHIIHVDNNS